MASNSLTADGYVSDSTGSGGAKIKHFQVHGVGVTAGDRAVLRSGGPTGTVVCQAVFSGTNGDAGPGAIGGNGIDCGRPIYYSEQKTGGTIRAEIVWE